ncbi:MAG: hypothetical protein QW764_02580 [Desulfurococcaceae archaeon]
MDPLRREKLENAIAYFAKRHYEKTGRPLTKIYLYKYLAFMDFLSVRETGKPAIGLRYLATENGVVPVGIIVPIEKHEIDLSYFSDYEIELMERLIENSDNISFDDIKAWKKALQRGENSEMLFEDELEDAEDEEVKRERLEVYKLLT